MPDKIPSLLTLPNEIKDAAIGGHLAIFVGAGASRL